MGSERKREREAERIREKREGKKMRAPGYFSCLFTTSLISPPASLFGSSFPSLFLSNLYTKPHLHLSPYPSLYTSLAFSFSLLWSQKEKKESQEKDAYEEEVGEVFFIFLSYTRGFWEDKKQAKVPRNQEEQSSLGDRKRECSFIYFLLRTTQFLTYKGVNTF